MQPIQHSSLMLKLHILMLSLKASNLLLVKGLVNKYATYYFEMH
jgi:hypothetical protein